MSVPNLQTTEGDLAMQYAYDTLSGDSVLAAMTPAPTVSAEWVAEETAFPRIVVEVISVVDLNALVEGYSRIMSRVRLQISVWAGNRNSNIVKAIAARITALLDGVGAVSVTGGTVVSMKRDNLSGTPDVVQNTIYPRRTLWFIAEVTLTTS